MVDLIKARFDCVLFDLGNTLIKQENPGVPYESLAVELLPGVEKLLKELHGQVKLGIVSNTQTITAADIKKKLATVGIDQFFDVVIATGELGIHKPDPAPITAAIKALETKPERTVYIGDIETDLQAAHAAGAAFAYTGIDIYKSLHQYLLHSESALDRALQTQPTFSQAHSNSVQKEFDGLAKPVGSLGKLEKVAVQIAGITHSHTPTVDPAAIAVFGGDHGIAADDSVTPWPQAITGMMLEVMGNNKAAVSVLADVADVYCQYINVGAVSDSKSRAVRNERVKSGTQDIRNQPAITREEAIAAMNVGAQTAERLIAGGSRSLCTGEVGIGNTTPSAALIAHFAKANAQEVTGRGSGIDDATYGRKVEIVEHLITKTKTTTDPIDVLAQIGGLEIAALTGYILRATSLQVPVVLDGVITLAAATVAEALKPKTTEFLIAAHCSSEPGSTIALKHLGLNPLLDLDLRLGEGTGALLSIPIIRSACQALSRMARISDLL
jgi:nicotinate-nucleotide--dimethylbenzimidazole phosphoribosyltransferase